MRALGSKYVGEGMGFRFRNFRDAKANDPIYRVIIGNQLRELEARYDELIKKIEEVIEREGVVDSITLELMLREEGYLFSIVTQVLNAIYEDLKFKYLSKRVKDIWALGSRELKSTRRHLRSYGRYCYTSSYCKTGSFIIGDRVVKSYLYGIDGLFKVYKISMADIVKDSDSIYKIYIPKFTKYNIRDSKVIKISREGELVRRFNSTVNNRKVPTLKNGLFRAFLSNYNYLCSTPITTIPFAFFLISSLVFRENQKIIYFITLLSETKLAIRRFLNFQHHAFYSILDKIEDSSVVPDCVVRFYNFAGFSPVSYTHLTLPTTERV